MNHAQPFRLLPLGSVPLPAWIYDRETLDILAVNQQAVDVYGYSYEQFACMRVDQIDASCTTHPKVTEEHRHHKRSDGYILEVLVTEKEVPRGKRAAILAIMVDMTKSNQSRRQLEYQSAYFNQVFSKSPDGIILLDSNATILDANPAFTELFGYSLEELRGSNSLDLIVPEDHVFESRSAYRKSTEQPARLKTVRCDKAGERIDVEIVAYPAYLGEDEIGIVAMYKDIRLQKQAEAEIEYRASHDSLTGLINRESMNKLLGEALKNSAPSVFMYLDLDQFKVINDVCGHSAGDGALVEIAGVLKNSIRDTDHVGRLGGDEFAVLLVNCSLQDGIEKAERIRKAFSAFRFTYEDRTFPVGVSIGVVETGGELEEIESVMVAADEACFMAKEKGRNRVQPYVSTDEELIVRRREKTWVARLNEALASDRFVLYSQEIRPFQPLKNAVLHEEVLIRYSDSDGSLVPPGAFVPSAERYNLMPTIDRWVLTEVCRLMAGLPCESRRVGINISGTTLNEESFADFARETISSSGIPFSSICFEITETAVISNLSSAKHFIHEMKDAGCSIALDDFGSGMSSFGYLRDIPADYLKIDGRFVRNIAHSEIDRAITESIHRVGTALGMKTVAEFVECQRSFKALKEIGVDFAQGYGVHRPERWVPGAVNKKYATR